MARRHSSSGADKKHGTRKKPMLHKARRGRPNKQQIKHHKWYIKHRAKLLRYAKKYYRRHKAKILRQAKRYRKLTQHGKKPFYKSGKIGGRWPRFKRFKRTGSHKRHKSSRRS